MLLFWFLSTSVSSPASTDHSLLLIDFENPITFPVAPPREIYYLNILHVSTLRMQEDRMECTRKKAQNDSRMPININKMWQNVERNVCWVCVNGGRRVIIFIITSTDSVPTAEISEHQILNKLCFLSPLNCDAKKIERSNAHIERPKSKSLLYRQKYRQKQHLINQS